MVTATAPEAHTGIDIENIGPIEHLHLDAKPGTITVLRGMNGQGKSTALEAIDAITRPGGKLESRDGTVGGKASGFGVTIKVGRGGANRRMGDLVVTAVEDRLSIADFVEPAVKDPVAADARRLKALVSLAGVAADPAIYHEIAGGEAAFAEVVKPETLEVTDPIILADKIKRDLESASRLYDQRATRIFGEITAKNAANKDLDLFAEHDSYKLQKAYDAALANLSKLEERQMAFDGARLTRESAEKALAKAESEYRGPTVEFAQHELQRAENGVTTARQGVETQSATVDLLRRQLHQAELELGQYKAELTHAESFVRTCKTAVETAAKHVQTISAWRETLAVELQPCPSDGELHAAQDAVKAARLANENGVRIRDGLKRQAEAIELAAARNAAVLRSESLRDAAKSVLDVLAGQVAGLIDGLKLDPELRIIVPHKIRKECYFADLSHGERWAMALDIAVAAFKRKGERGVLAIPQEAWEGLDGRNRHLVAQHVARTNLIVFTAEATREESADGLGVEVINGGK